MDHGNTRLKKYAYSGIDDKRQITGVFTVTLDGCVHPPQLIYQSTKSACLPSTSLPSTTFPSDWHVTSTPNHRENESTTKYYIQKILSSYLSKKRMEPKLSSDQQALCIFDNFGGQLTNDVLQMLEDTHVNIVIVPPNCRDCLQPLDLSVNKSAKDFLKSNFQQWYSDIIFDQQDDGSPLQPITFPMYVMKPPGGHWSKEFY